MLGFVPIQNDVSRMAKAYINDIGQFLNLANRENRRILDKTDLI